ncbi:MAG: tRNA lysidine(34) synthetase TilS [Opitutales bacterium]
MEALPAPEALRAAVQAAGRALAIDEPSRARLASEPAIAVAVSGGADSVALLAALYAEEGLRPRLHVLHYDHRVRGAESAGDAAFVSALAAALGLPCHLGQRETVGVGSETELRRVRLDWMARTMARLGARALCLGHHLDDRLETFLLRGARGAGAEGLSAPRAHQAFRDGTFRLRPLLGHRRAVLRAALFNAGVPWREDATNADKAVPRNRVRADVIPAIEASMGPGWAAGVARATENLGEASDALRSWLAELRGLPTADGRCDVSRLRDRPRALARLACSELLWSHGVEDLGGPTFEAMVDAVASGRPGQFQLGGLNWNLTAGWLAVETAREGWGEVVRPLPVDGTRAECGLAAERVAADATLWARLSRGEISPAGEVYLNILDAAGLGWRSRLPGDRYQPFGAPGSAKVSDLLIDRKVPHGHRVSLPVVLLGDSVIWVPGVPPADNLRLHGPCESALRLTWQAPRLGSTLQR